MFFGIFRASSTFFRASLQKILPKKQNETIIPSVDEGTHGSCGWKPPMTMLRLLDVGTAMPSQPRLALNGFFSAGTLRPPACRICRSSRPNRVKIANPILSGENAEIQKIRRLVAYVPLSTEGKFALALRRGIFSFILFFYKGVHSSRWKNNNGFFPGAICGG